MVKVSLSALCCLAVVLPPASAGAQLDPPSDSPAGKVYELPVDKGRRDAAPPRATSPGGPLDEGSFYRSENNFGTSSRVPGDPTEKAGKAASGSDGANEVAAVDVQPAAADLGDPDQGGSFALLGAIAVAGLAIGLVSRRSWGA